MDYKEYEKKLMEELKQMNQKMEIIASPVLRNNGEEQTVIVILPEGGICSPEISLLSVYEHFCQNHLTVRQSAEYVMDFYGKITQAMNEYCQLEEDLKDFEKMKDHLTIKMINREWNQKMLEEVVSIPFLDLAGVFYLTNSLETMRIGIKVTRSLKERWGVSLDTLLKTALYNLRMHGRFHMREIYEILSEIPGYQLSSEEKDPAALYVVTDASKKNGPAVMLFPEIMKQMADELEDNLLLLPSSIHELIVLRSEHADIPELKRIVREINHAVVQNQEILGNGVYRFDRQTLELTVA